MAGLLKMFKVDSINETYNQFLEYENTIVITGDSRITIAELEKRLNPKRLNHVIKHDDRADALHWFTLEKEPKMNQLGKEMKNKVEDCVRINGTIFEVPNKDVEKAREMMLYFSDELATLKDKRKYTKKTIGYLPKAIKADFDEKIADLENCIETLDEITG